MSLRIKNLHLATLLSRRTVMLLEIFQDENGGWCHRFDPERPDIKITFIKDGKDVCVCSDTNICGLEVSVMFNDMVEHHADFSIGGDAYLRLILSAVIQAPAPPPRFQLRTVKTALLTNCAAYLFLLLFLPVKRAFFAVALGFGLNLGAQLIAHWLVKISWRKSKPSKRWSGVL